MSLVLMLGLVGSASAELVGYWKLDEDAGTTAADSSGNGNDGTWEDGPTVVAGQYGNALAFDNSRVAIPASDSLTADMFQGSFTLTAWINASRTGNTWQQIFRAIKTDTTSNDTLFINNDGRLSWRGRVNAGWAGGMCETAGDVVAADEWTHVAVTGDEANFRVYVNGAVSQESAFQVTDGTNETYYIGGNPGSTTESYSGAADEVAVFDHALTAAEVVSAMAGIAAAELAGDPSPEDEAVDVPREAVLSWSPGELAATHDVYLGTSFDDVNNASRANPMGVLVSEGQADTTYDPPGVLEFGQTYYWRIDEVNAAPDNTIFRGSVWGFTIEPLGYPIEGVIATSTGTSEAGAGPENTVNGSGLNENDEHSTATGDMWLAVPGAEPLSIQYEFDRVYKLHELLIWNYNVQFEPVLGFGVKDVTVEYSENGVDWTALGDAEFAQATAADDYIANTIVALQGVAAKFVKLIVNSGYGPMGQFGLSEVRFLYIPVQAREPEPADGATAVSVDATLGWRAGRGAATHDVSLGTDSEALGLVDSVSDTSYVPGNLEFGSTYYWRIDEVNEAEAVMSWEGDVWSFATQAFAVIDDFESYDDDENRIFDTWLDGFANETGATVGYFEAPFAEQTIVNGGSQSMPLEYVNDAAPFYSEAEYDLGGVNLATNGADTLRLFVAGQAPGFAEMADGTIVMNGIGADIWNAADEFRYVYKTLSGDGSMVARVDSLVDSDVWAKGGVMIRETVDAGSTFAAVYMTGDNGVRFQGRLTTDASAVSDSSVATDEQIALREPAWVKIERVGNAFNGYYSTDGENWVDMAWNPQTIDMANEVTIGLALTSHNAAVTTGAAFAGVAESGGVSGNWQIAEIGAVQPTTGNAIEPLYVALEDTSGNVAVATHPNPAAVGIATWQEWLIPYSDLAGINLNRVAFMYIGVGDRDNPAAGGAGLIFIDDIGYGRPAPVE
jgi:hypothetical protein